MGMKSNKMLIVSGCLCCLMLASCNKKQTASMSGNYKTMTVTASDITLDHEYTAKLEGEQAVEIRPQVSGTITKICVDEGAHVSKGQTLFIIDQVAYKAALQTAEAQVNSARASLANYKLTLESKRELRKQNVVSDFDLNQAKNNVAEAQATLANAQAQVLSARNNLSYTVVKSPASGVIGMIPYRVGALVSSSIDQPLTTVSNNTNVRAYFSITENALQEIIDNYGSTSTALKRMPTVKLKTNSGNIYGHPGHVDAISGNVDSSTGSVSLRATFSNPEGLLRNGGNGTIVMPYVIKNKIIIPQEATYELQDKVFVYRVVNGKAKSTEIKVIEHSDGEHYVVLSGLSVGDRIISEGAGLVQEGIAIK
jgi:membrane fusion protein (multidrug efflux system)